MDQSRFPLPTFTNREDFVLPIALNDDTTGAALNMAYITTATPGAAFTASSWNVSIGGRVYPSGSTLTIPAYPITTELLTVTLMLGPIIPPPPPVITTGMPITIADPTGLNTMSGYVTGFTPPGQVVCQIGNSFQFEIRRAKPHEAGVGYVTWYDFGVQSDVGPLLSAALGTGIWITGLGNILIMIPESQFKQLNGDGTYTAALTYTDTQNTRQVFRAPLPVIQGGVTN